jgi:hypothetical protein
MAVKVSTAGDSAPRVSRACTIWARRGLAVVAFGSHFFGHPSAVDRRVRARRATTRRTVDDLRAALGYWQCRVVSAILDRWVSIHGLLPWQCFLSSSGWYLVSKPGHWPGCGGVGGLIPTVLWEMARERQARNAADLRRREAALAAFAPAVPVGEAGAEDRADVAVERGAAWYLRPEAEVVSFLSRPEPEFRIIRGS